MPDQNAPAGIDPRAPRFSAGITSVLLIVTILLALLSSPGTATLGARLAEPAFLLLAVIAVLFAWGVLSPRTAPWGALFRGVVRPRLGAPDELEDPRPPRFAQGVGLFCAVVGLVLQVAGVPWGLAIAAAATFVASFLNAAFGYCLGCQMYLLLQRAGVIGRGATA